MDLFNLISKVELITEDRIKTIGLIQDLKDNKVYISIPSDDKEFKLLRIGDSVMAMVYDNNKVTGYNAIITNRISGDTPIYELSFSEKSWKIQRRDDVRVPNSIPIYYSDNKYLLNITNEKLDVKELDRKINKYLNNGMTSDLSAGGLRFTCIENLNLGTMLLLKFSLKNNDLIITKGKIVYKELKSSPKETIYIYGIKFIDISEKTKEKIIQHNFILMRKNKLK